MVVFDKKNFIPIGCSCINQFQLDFYFGIQKNKTLAQKIVGLFDLITMPSIFNSTKKKSGLFDWIIVSPKSTIQVFEAIQSNNVYNLFTDKRNYSIECGRLKNDAFECLYFWHEDGVKILENDGQFHLFQSKVTHLIDNMLCVAKTGSCFLLWSNIQPNLKSAVSFRNDGWDAFRLSEEHYVKITEMTKSIFGKDSRCLFFCRAEDVDVPKPKWDDVIIIELERSSEFKGAVDLYAPVLNMFATIKD